MAFTYGFYNSQNGDRVYDADQFSSFLDGIVYDGVYEAVGDKFFVSSIEDEALTIQVGPGRAWLMHTWSLNDTNCYLTATAALDVYDRIDAVVLEVDKEIRENSIKIIEGTPSDSVPSRPVLKNEYNIRQYPLAYIYREHGTTTIPNTHAGTSETDTESAAECIKFMVGSSELPLCSALALAGIPSGGKIGQVLAKKSSESAAVGWYDWNHLPSDEPWYIVTGITEENVIAAWKFKNAYTLEEALTNVNKNGITYVLTKSDGVTWTTGSGLFFPASLKEYITNTAVADKSGFIYSCAFGYSGMATGASVSGGVTLSERKLLASSVYTITTNSATGAGYPAFYSSSMYKNISDHADVCIGIKYPEGVLGGNYSASANAIFYNGLRQSLISKTGHSTLNGYWATVGVFATSGGTRGQALSPINLSAIVFYNCELSDTQHMQLAEKINNL